MKKWIVIFSLALWTSVAFAEQHWDLAQSEQQLQGSEVNQQWWSGRTAGIVGGIAGGFVATMGALIGILAGLGRAKRFVLTAMKAMVVCGVVCLVLGVIALLQSQPYAVYYPLLLLGLISSLVFGLNIRVACKRYESLELRKMQAVDAE